MASLVDELKKVPLFSGLSQRQLKKLGRGFKERQFKAGTSVVRQGQMSGVGFFVITEGEAYVSVDGSEVARLGPGDHFGELALISERVRSATVTAAGPLNCLVMAFWDFREFAKESLKSRRHLEAAPAPRRAPHPGTEQARASRLADQLTQRGPLTG